MKNSNHGKITKNIRSIPINSKNKCLSKKRIKKEQKEISNLLKSEQNSNRSLLNSKNDHIMTNKKTKKMLQLIIPN